MIPTHILLPMVVLAGKAIIKAVRDYYKNSRK